VALIIRNNLVLVPALSGLFLKSSPAAADVADLTVFGTLSDGNTIVGTVDVANNKR
jgi:hypothetical protein